MRASLPGHARERREEPAGAGGRVGGVPGPRGRVRPLEQGGQAPGHRRSGHGRAGHLRGRRALGPGAATTRGAGRHLPQGKALWPSPTPR